ncbi:hypothetical protein DJFAAGMI_01056 [Comamonas sp. PE63]|uniref:Uncharacterized protein n=1 Tax=Comamonas brasiliensis TaxID=1812482 RepID=A0ABS5LPP3_9BURK|nr:hypothetical protein [Comamonas sp. PE63]MBS3018324.1 hypothetical protein [Comamonas sp. PE63]
MQTFKISSDLIREIEGIPPSIPLVYEHVFSRAFGDYQKCITLLKELIPVLQEQSRYFSIERLNSDNNSNYNNFKIYADSGLDILDPRANCINLNCRIEASNRLAKSLGLIADKFYITDHITDSLCNNNSFNDNEIVALLDNYTIIYNLMPLVIKGIIQFNEAVRPICISCLKNFEEEVDDITDNLYSKFRNCFTLEPMGNRNFAIHTEDLFNPPVVLRVEKKHKKWRKKIDWEDQYRYIIRSEVRKSLWTGSMAGKNLGSVFTNSSAGIAAVLHKEGKFSSAGPKNIFDQKREFSIPWVNDLDILQIIELREEAHRAFPLFREKISYHLTGFGNTESPENIINELKYESKQVTNELDIIAKKSVSFWKKPFNLMSLGVAAVSIAVDQPLGAATGLLPLLQYLGDHRHEKHSEEESIKSKPGYVLVKAAQILKHAH